MEMRFEDGRLPLVSASLRFRLIVSITVVLLMILLPGSALVYLHAVHEVDVELHAAANVGAHTIHNAVDDAEEAEHPQRHLELLIADFDGDRHLRATLLDPAGHVLHRSTPLKPSDPAPEWFYQLLARRASTFPIDLPAPFRSVGTILLETDAHNEISEVWDDAVLTLAMLVVFCGLNAAIVYWIMGRALRPLETVSTAFDRLGAGDYNLRVPELGSREFAKISGGLNRLAARLADAEARRIRLERQLAAVQEEERAELARDLHDEIGPLLFAVGVDLSVIQHDEAVRNSPLAASVVAVRESISHIYGEIKRILGRLRTATPAELGLGQAVENLLSFWRARYPSVRFSCNVPEDGFEPEVDDVVYHIIMESLSNALRHGSPTRLEVSAVLDDRRVIASVRDDGGGFSRAGNEQGFGLFSMEQRVDALGGSLEVSESPDQGGVMVIARIPVSGSSYDVPDPASLRAAS
jgi:two-component system, NarL family, sensor histidine kinase UhpB